MQGTKSDIISYISIIAATKDIKHLITKSIVKITSFICYYISLHYCDVHNITWRVEYVFHTWEMHRGCTTAWLSLAAKGKFIMFYSFYLTKSQQIPGILPWCRYISWYRERFPFTGFVFLHSSHQHMERKFRTGIYVTSQINSNFVQTCIRSVRFHWCLGMRYDVVASGEHGSR